MVVGLLPALILILGSSAAVSFVTDPAEAAPSAGGTIAFVSSRDGNDEIYVMTADGSSGVTRLTNNPAGDHSPAWSPDGSQIAFTSTRDGKNEIYVMNADGTGITRLTTTESHLGSSAPAWCGNRIVFVSDRYLEHFPDIYVMNADGTGVTRLTISNADFDTSPAWSPTCGQIAFVKDPSGDHEIYVMNADGTGVTRLTNSAGYDDDPAWSPNGAQIAFTSARNGNNEIYVMNADGTGVTRLTNDPGNDHSPAWSPDGSQIAFTSDGAIHVMNADGTGVALLTDRGDHASFRPSVSGAWPNQPPNFQAFNDQPWDSVTGNGWSWLPRTSSKDPDIAMDPTAPLSPQNVIRMIFTTDMSVDSEPSVHWIGLPGNSEIYTAWWIKLSPDWTPGPAFSGMMTSLFTNLSGQVATGLYHACVWPEVCSREVTGPPYKVGVNTEWAPYGQQIWYPNVTTTWINPGEWHRIEFYYKWETRPGASGDGIIRWWVDGVLNGDYRAVHYPDDSFVEFQLAPTLPQPPPAEQYMYVDHTFVSVP